MGKGASEAWVSAEASWVGIAVPWGHSAFAFWVLASFAYRNDLPSKGVLNQPENTLAYEGRLILLGLSPKFRAYVLW